MPDTNIKVLFISGWGRSGSTLLGNILGELDGFFHAGELRTIWGPHDRQRLLCGCGVPVRECEIWSSVVAAVLHDPDVPTEDPGAVRSWQQDVTRTRYVIRLLSTSADRPSGWPSLDCYAQVMNRLYKRLAERTDSRVVVDSSKRVANAALLHLLPRIQPYYVHLVRDPRAVAYSWQRTKASPDSPSGYMPRSRPSATTLNWLKSNLGMELVRRHHPSSGSMLVRYESFIARPQAVIVAIARMVGESPNHLPFVDDHTVQLEPNHTLGGNPDRHRHGRTLLRADEEWLVRQHTADRLSVTALTLPLLLRYGYSVRSSRRHGKGKPVPSRIPTTEDGNAFGSTPLG